MNALQIFTYEGNAIEFETINGHVMANATSMCKVFGKKPDDIFKTKSWQEFENVVIDDLQCRFEDIRSVKNGGIGSGSWIHQELVLELARRLSPKFALWCNRMIAELLKNGSVELKPMTPAEMILHQAQILVKHEQEMAELKEAVRQIDARTQTRPDYFTVVGYATLNGMSVNYRVATKVEQSASRICKQRGIQTDSCPDPRFGSVNMYPSTVLKEVFSMPIV